MGPCIIMIKGLILFDNISNLPVLVSTKTDNATASFTIDITGHVSGTNKLLLDFDFVHRCIVYGRKTNFFGLV